MTRLFVVRHGNTFEAGEPPRRVGARTDLPLTAEGVAQAEALGRQLRYVGFGSAFCSSLIRTRHTAERILAAQRAPPPLGTQEFLVEIDHGIDENQPEAMVEARVGREALETWDRDSIAPEGWETNTVERIAAWRAFAAEATGDVLLVTSNGAARFAMIALGLASGPMKLRTGAYGVIETGPDGRFRLVEWDRRPD